MKISSSVLLELLCTADKLCIMDLFTIALTNGTVLRYTSGDYNIKVGDHVFTPMTIECGAIGQSIGLSVDDIDLTLYYDATDVIPGGTTIPKAIRSGALDYAVVIVEQVFMEQWAFAVSSDYSLLLTAGRLDVPVSGRTKAECKIKSFTELLNAQLPKNVYEANCINVLYDSACTIDRSEYAVNGVALTGSTSEFVLCNLSKPNNYFDMGYIVWNTGPNTGHSATIKRQEDGKITPIWPFPYPPIAGNSFTVYPGCNRTIATCVTKFNNLEHYRGTPFIPIPESVT